MLRRYKLAPRELTRGSRNRQIERRAPVKLRGVAAALLVALVFVAPLQAATARTTKSDAKGALRTLTTALDYALRVLIRPLAGSPWDGRHFCSLDWHTVVFSLVEGG